MVKFSGSAALTSSIAIDTGTDIRISGSLIVSGSTTTTSLTSSFIMLRSPSTSSNATIVFSGSLTSSIRLEVLQDGSVAFIGSNGVLLGVADSLSGSLFAVNDISGFPILEVFSDDRVVMGAYNQNTLVVTGSNIGIRKTTPTLGFALDISGSVAITGSLNVSSGITGSLLGTASYALNALTASYALNAAGGGGGVISSSFQLTNGQGFAFTTASNVTFNQVTSSYMMLRSPNTSSNASIVFSGSLTSSIRLEALQDGGVSFIGSSGTLFGISDSLSGSLMSVNDISGMPIFEVFSDERVVMGAYNQNVLVVTGSDIGIGKANPNLAFILDVSGSVAITGSLNVSAGITGSLLGTSSFAITASYAFSALTASYALNSAGGGGGSGVISSSFQLTNGQGFAFTTASNVTFGQVTASAMLISGSGILMPSGSLFMGDTNNAKFVVGSNTAETIFGQADLFQVLGTGATVGFVGRYSNNANGPRWGLAKSRSTTVGGRAVVQSGDSLGRFVWFADNGTSLAEAAAIEVKNIGGDTTTNVMNFLPGSDGPVLELFYSTTLIGAKVTGSLDVQTSVRANSITASFIDINKPLGGDTSFVLDVSGSSAFTGSVFITGSLVVSGTFANMSGSVNFIPKFASSSILRPSNIVDNGVSVGFFKTAPTAKVDINGQTIITGSLDIVIDAVAGWNRFIVTSSRMWGDTNAYVTIGSGSGGIMLNNPHAVWNSGNAAAGIRMGRSSGTSTGAWYEVAVGASDDFFIAKNGGRNNAQLYINTAGNMSLGKATASVRLDVNGNVLVSGSTRSPHFSVEPYLGSNPIISFTGSAGSSSIRLETLSDGSVAFIGSSGTLFGVTDSLTGSLMSVSDITGLPIFEVFSNDTIVAGKYGAPAMIISGSSLIATGSIFGTAYFIVVTSSATNITLSLAESGDYFRTTAATAVGIQVPPQSSVAWPSNTEIMFEQAGAGQITFTTGSGVTINSSETLKTQKQYSVVGLKRVAQDTWTLTGERELV